MSCRVTHLLPHGTLPCGLPLAFAAAQPLAQPARRTAPHRFSVQHHVPRRHLFDLRQVVVRALDVGVAVGFGGGGQGPGVARQELSMLASRDLLSGRVAVGDVVVRVGVAVVGAAVSGRAIVGIVVVLFLVCARAVIGGSAVGDPSKRNIGASAWRILWQIPY